MKVILINVETVNRRIIYDLDLNCVKLPRQGILTSKSKLGECNMYFPYINANKMKQ
jgi:hypothetical protein